ncbi:hypothetical protein FQR65_LT13902 [Abscondita terminalis]|nr:hypothetical protein FQR65_LT13902 [Abscondita terminalis]
MQKTSARHCTEIILSFEPYIERQDTASDLRSQTRVFDFKLHCIFCGESADNQKEKQKAKRVIVMQNSNPMPLHQKVQVDPAVISETEAFEKACVAIQGEDKCQFSLYDFQSMIEKLLPPWDSLYTIPHVKKMLLSYFGKSIYFSELPGISAIFCLSDSADAVITKNWYSKKNKDNT